VKAVGDYQQEAVAHLPALESVLARVREAPEVLPCATLVGRAGQQAMAALARRYLDVAPHPEAAIVLRETLVSRHAARLEAVEVNCSFYDPCERHFAEDAWGKREIAAVRNDIERGGFNRQPLGAGDLKENLDKLVAEYLPEQPEGSAKRSWFVRHHPGAGEWAARQGIDMDMQVDHLDPSEVNAGGTVIGTLPVHLVAEVCNRGGRYLNLSLDLPPEARGQKRAPAIWSATVHASSPFG
jgi:CRISPR-associated protein Csx16